MIPDYLDTDPNSLAEVAPLVRAGGIKCREDFIVGFEKLPATFFGLFDVSQLAKLIVRLGLSW